MNCIEKLLFLMTFKIYNFAFSAIFNRSGLLSNAPDCINWVNAFSLSSIGVVCSDDINFEVTVSKTRSSGFIKLPSSCCHRTINAYTKPNWLDLT